MSGQPVICFGRYRLHRTQGLTRGRHEVRVTPKALAVLYALAGRPGEILTKEELFRTVWAQRVVSDAALSSCIRELRRALDDDAREPRYIETLHRRGFRFLASGVRAAAAEPHSAGGVPPATFVGRAAALQRLSDALAEAGAGVRRVVFVTGEPGIGKTALLEICLAQVHACGSCRVVRADCMDRYGAGEAYQPLLEILSRLCRQAQDERCLAVLRRLAPTWLVQIPSLVSPAELAALQRRATDVTRERMQRELNEALEEIAGETPLVLCLEDLHWSDVATLEWIDSFARRRERGAIALLGSFRPGQRRQAAPCAETLAAELRMRARASRIELARLDAGDIATYLRSRFAPMRDRTAAVDDLAHRVHCRTDGNPLFVVNLLSDLIDRGLLAVTESAWQVPEGLDLAHLGVPGDIRDLIERQLERLSAGERALLEVASLLGGRCVAAAIGAACGVSLGDTEAMLGSLARRHAMVRESVTVEWPDGTLSASFEFRHALYREVLADGLSPSRRVELNRLLGHRLEAAYAGRASDIAAQLALHFDEGRDAARALRYYQMAAETDRGRSAHASAQRNYERALALLGKVAPGDLRDESEAALRSGLGGVLMQVRGWGAEEVEEAYSRARHLHRSRGARQQEFAALWNLWVFDTARGMPGKARVRAQELLALAQAAHDTTARLQAHHAFWTTLFQVGDLRGAQEHAREGIALEADGDRDSNLAFGGHDTGVCARVFLARALLLSGKPEAAIGLCNESLATARSLDHPFTLAFALMHASAIHQERRDALLTRQHAAAALELAREQGFSLLQAWATCFLGWATVQVEDAQRGSELIRSGIDAARAGRSEMFQSQLLGLLAEVQLAQGNPQQAMQTLAAALEFTARTGECTYLAELYRLRGEARLLSHARADQTTVQEDFSAALRSAQSQGATLFEERALRSLRGLRRPGGAPCGCA